MPKKILVINTGSTSTKVGVFTDRQALFRETAAHSPEDIAGLHGYDEWRRFHHDAVNHIVARHPGSVTGLDLVVSRGGLTRPIEGGAFAVSDAMIRDLRAGTYGWHPCNTGPETARRIAGDYGIPAMIYDAPVADELGPLARISGLKGIERRAAFHVLNQKSAAGRAARALGIPYRSGRFVVAHLGGGITVGAHVEGRIVDGTHGLGEGPFTPRRSGALPLQGVLDLCFSGRYSRDELDRLLFSRGGVFSYLGTHDIREVEARAENGDDAARLILRAMGYQVGKAICAMAAVMAGAVDAVVVTGGLAGARSVMDEILFRVRFLGPVFCYPGEDELESLAAGGMNVLSGVEEMKAYE